MLKYLIVLLLVSPAFAVRLEISPEEVVCYGSVDECPNVKEQTWFGKVSNGLFMDKSESFYFDFSENLSGDYFLTGYWTDDGVYVSEASGLADRTRIQNSNSRMCAAVCECKNASSVFVTCPTRSLQTINRKFNAEFAIRTLEISGDGKLVHVADSEKGFTTKEKLIIDDGNWFVSFADKYIKINILPDDVEAEGAMELTGNNYVIKSSREARILFLFPVVVEKEIRINVNSGDAMVKEPWWGFLAW
jgi:hypothetical protein